MNSYTDPPHSSHKKGHGLHILAIGTALAAGAVIVSPYVLPYVGIGSTDLALESISMLHATGVGTGLVGIINTGLKAVPFIGSTLAAGGMGSAAISGGVGIGGTLLGRFLEKKHDGKTGINWGKVIKYGAIATSALIALPSILTGISVGLVYLGTALAGVEVGSTILEAVSATIGAMGSMNAANIGVVGAMAALPHLLTCGAGLLAPLFSFSLAGSDSKPAEPPASYAQRVNQSRMMQHSQPSMAM